MLTGKYTGQTNQTERHGFGVYTYGHGYFQYVGEWQHGIKHGKGKLIMSDGSYFEGTFDQNEITGRGKHYYAWSGNTYEGEFHLGERHGYGRMIFGNGDMYEGSWVNNQMEEQSTGDSYFTKVEYELPSSDLENGFELTICVHTETEKLLTEGNKRYSRLVCIDFNVVPISDPVEADLEDALREDSSASLDQFTSEPVQQMEEIRGQMNESITTPEAINGVDTERQQSIVLIKRTLRVHLEETGRGCAQWTNLTVHEETIPPVSETPVEEETDKVADNIPREPDEYVVVVEDVTPMEPCQLSSAEMPFISPEVLQSPSRLPPLFIRLIAVQSG
ncbi:unnamed protein product [Echinostoma caproni]|uniref:MORN repeat-containing protein 1 n=1 Tax=Echinostoma caproni TaxID=27848 RepID=A0A183A959_9TREM|nr:unnamed protein product [Echinostoma caproni]